VKSLVKPAPKVGLKTSISEAARLMIESGVRQRPVFEGDKLLGFVTDEEIIHGAVLEKWGESMVEGVMTRDPVVVDDDSSVGAALSLFRLHNVSHLPVVRNDS
jgi:CBS domain-containing protein